MENDLKKLIDESLVVEDDVSIVSTNLIDIYNKFSGILSSKSYTQNRIHYKQDDLYFSSYFIGNLKTGLNNVLNEVFGTFLETDFLNLQLNQLPYFQDGLNYGLSFINVNKLNDLFSIIDPETGEVYSYYRKEIYNIIGIDKKYIEQVETIAAIYEVMAEIAQEYTARYTQATYDDYNRVLSL